MNPLCHEPALLIAKIESTASICFRFILTLLIFTANVVRDGVSDGASDGAQNAGRRQATRPQKLRF